MNTHFQKTLNLFKRACMVLKLSGFTLRQMKRRTNSGKSFKKFTLGRIDLRTKTITLDIYTPRRRKPKSYNSILRIMAHEFAHYQKPPFQQRYKGHLIFRRHYPAFYKRANKNIKKFKKDPVLGKYFFS